MAKEHNRREYHTERPRINSNIKINKNDSRSPRASIILRTNKDDLYENSILGAGRKMAELSTRPELSTIPEEINNSSKHGFKCSQNYNLDCTEEEIKERCADNTGDAGAGAGAGYSDNSNDAAGDNTGDAGDNIGDAGADNTGDSGDNNNDHESYEEDFNIDHESYEEDFNIDHESYEEDFNIDHESYEEDFNIEETPYKPINMLSSYNDWKLSNFKQTRSGQTDIATVDAKKFDVKTMKTIEKIILIISNRENQTEIMMDKDAWKRLNE